MANRYVKRKSKNASKIPLWPLLIGALLLIMTVFVWRLNALSSNSILLEKTPLTTEAQASVDTSLSSKGHTLDNPKIILNPYKISPLTALVIFETETNTAPVVTINGKDELSSFRHTFESNKQHLLPIYGLYPDTINKIIVQSGNQQKVISIKTKPLPKEVVIPTKIASKRDKLTNDLYFFSPSSKNYTAAYDVNGDIRWYLTSQTMWKIDRLNNGHLLLSSDRLINPPYYSTGLFEMDLLGKVYNEFSLPGGYHHDYFEMDNGNLLVASDDFNDPVGTVEDIIVEIDRKTGDVIKRFDLKDILNMKDGQSEDWTAYDWFHNNSVWYDAKTDSITLSGRHQDAVINISYQTGELNWIIGDPTNWSAEFQKYFFRPIGELEWQWSQHAAMITPEGYVFILDNGNNKSKLPTEFIPANKSYTRGVMYEINTKDMTIKQVWQYGKQLGSEFYSPYISDVDYIAKEHYIVHSGGISYKDGQISNKPAGLANSDTLISRTVELKDNELVFEITLPTNNYRVEKMPLYATNEKFNPSPPNRLGSLGETPVDAQRFGFITDSVAGRYIEQRHEISATNEGDRLEIKGRFKRDDQVKAILYHAGKIREYSIKVSKKPYTALCVDVFTEDENLNGIIVTKYINSDGLWGKHSLYLEINGVLYSTEKSVRF